MQSAERLYIIGNGFDLHYGIKSSYKDFLSYLETNDPLLAEVLFEICSGELWRNFEEALGSLSPGCLFSNIFNLIGSDDEGDFEWERQSASWNYHYQAMRKEVDVGKLSKVFRSWIQQIDTSAAHSDGVIVDTDDTRYLTFNYTMTLEERLGIDPRKILHIHGSAEDEQLIFGHSGALSAEPLAPQAFYEQDMLEELRIKFIHQTKKPVHLILANSLSWLKTLSTVHEIIVAGFSFSPVDLPYIREINSRCANASWSEFSQNPDAGSKNPIVAQTKVIPYPEFQ